jgi:hypothetical protein
MSNGSLPMVCEIVGPSKTDDCEVDVLNWTEHAFYGQYGDDKRPWWLFEDDIFIVLYKPKDSK